MLEREIMVEQQIRRRGVTDLATLQAMSEVPRHLFVPPELQKFAYTDSPLPIGHNQTISQPYIVALMTKCAELTPESVVLDIGTGSGYAAAILSRIVKQVYSIERVEELAERAKKVLSDLGYNNVEVKTGDGSLGWPEKAPFDAIIVTAGAPVIPQSFIGQLKEGGRVVIPVGDALGQELIRLRKLPSGQYASEFIEYVRFVPLVGEQGW